MSPYLSFWIAWAVGLLALLGAWPRLTGLTLRGPWSWLAAFWLAMGIAEALVQSQTDDVGEPMWAAAARYIAAIGVFCPVMSVLGAKRPQHTAWHFIVGSLWVVLVLPAAEVLVLHPGQELFVLDARAWFLTILIGMGTLHLLMTRFWLAGLLFAFGQVALLGQYLPLIAGSESWNQQGWGPAWGAAAFAAAMVIAWLTRAPAVDSRWDRLWFDFRDMYGVLWALRVASRVNEAASLNDWPIELRWQGFVKKPSGVTMQEPPADIAEALDSCLRNLLRRFVSTEWTSERLNSDASTTAATGDLSMETAEDAAGAANVAESDSAR